jgi:hypothetical protein
VRFAAGGALVAMKRRAVNTSILLEKAPNNDNEAGIFW